MRRQSPTPLLAGQELPALLADDHIKIQQSLRARSDLTGCPSIVQEVMSSLRRSTARSGLHLKTPSIDVYIPDILALTWHQTHGTVRIKNLPEVLFVKSHTMKQSN